MNVDDLPSEGNIFIFIKKILNTLIINQKFGDEEKKSIVKVLNDLTVIESINNDYQKDYLPENEIGNQISLKIKNGIFKVFSNTITQIKIAVEHKGKNKFYISKDINIISFEDIIQFGKIDSFLILILSKKKILRSKELSLALDLFSTEKRFELNDFLDVLDLLFLRNIDNWLKVYEELENSIRYFNSELKPNKVIQIELTIDDDFTQFDFELFKIEFLHRVPYINNTRLISIREGSVILTLEIESDDIDMLLISLRKSGIPFNKITNLKISKTGNENPESNLRIEEVKKELKILVTEDLKDSIERMEYYWGEDHPKYNDLLLMRARLNRVGQKNTTNSEPQELIQQEINKITIELLGIIDTMKPELFDKIKSLKF